MRARQQFENAFGIKLTKSKHIEILLMLVCLEIVLALSYLGYIQIAPISVTTLHILVVVAAMYFGPWDATIIAAVFAFTSMWKASVTAMEPGDLIFSPILSGKPVESIVMALGTRIVFAIIAGFAFRWFFSKPRKLKLLGISIISIIATLIHSLLVYVCMETFFNSTTVQTTTGLGKTLILNNLILFAVTVVVVLFAYKLNTFNRIQNFFKKTSAEGMDNVKMKSRVAVLIYILLVLCCIFVAVHFFTRLGTYIESYGEQVGDGYVEWTYALVIQFVVGFIGVFGLLTIFVKWIQEYYAAIALEANIRARENAEIANKSKSQFLFNMSHDIRTPMNAILGFTDMALRHEDEPDKVDDSLRKIKASGEHLLSLVNDILEMSRIESGKMELAEDPIDMRKAVETVGNMCQTIAIPKSIDLTVQFGELKNPYVYADELHANEVLINLISNAVKYSDEGGKILFSIDQVSDMGDDGKATYRFEVSDNGIGMSDEFQKHLFEAFSREDTEAVSKVEGAGLGLSIVKQIVEKAGGTISVRSKVGVGSTFTIDVPLRVMGEKAIADFELKMPKPLKEITEDDTLEGKKVLLVEDNEMNREIASDILDEAGLIVETAEDGEKAVKIVKEKGIDYYDLILMDIQMPIMNGYEATQAIRELPDGNNIPIIALSANAFKEDIEKSLDAGMNAHIAKPIDVKALFEAMRMQM